MTHATCHAFGEYHAWQIPSVERTYYFQVVGDDVYLLDAHEIPPVVLSFLHNQLEMLCPAIN